MKAISWEEIYKKQYPLILGVCRRYVKAPETAEDIAQEVFFVAIKKEASYSGKGSLEGWIRKIAVNTCLIYLKQQKQKITANEVDLENTKDITSEDHLAMNSTKSKIINADFSQKELINFIDLLPAHHKAVFNLYVIDKYSHQEISKLLDISVGTSKSHLFRARKKLQNLMLEKAEEKEIPRRKKWGILFFLPLSTITDRLFATNLKRYEPDVGTFHIPDQIRQAGKVQNPHFTPALSNEGKLLFSKTTIVTSATIMVCIASVIPFLWPATPTLQKEEASPEIKQIAPIITSAPTHKLSNTITKSISTDSSNYRSKHQTSKNQNTKDSNKKTLNKAELTISNVQDTKEESSDVSPVLPSDTNTSPLKQKRIIVPVRKEILVKKQITLRDTIYK